MKNFEPVKANNPDIIQISGKVNEIFEETWTNQFGEKTDFICIGQDQWDNIETNEDIYRYNESLNIIYLLPDIFKNANIQKGDKIIAKCFKNIANLTTYHAPQLGFHITHKSSSFLCSSIVKTSKLVVPYKVLEQNCKANHNYQRDIYGNLRLTSSIKEEERRRLEREEEERVFAEELKESTRIFILKLYKAAFRFAEDESQKESLRSTLREKLPLSVEEIKKLERESLIEEN